MHQIQQAKVRSTHIKTAESLYLIHKQAKGK
jgi:hypothetical protein